MLFLVFIVSVLLGSGFVMGKLAFHSGLGVKRWVIIGLLLGPTCYPLFSTHKRFAMKRAVGQFTSIINL